MNVPQVHGLDVVLDLVLRPPNEQLVTRSLFLSVEDKLIIWIRCVGAGRHLKHAGRGGSRTGFEKRCVRPSRAENELPSGSKLSGKNPPYVQI